MWTNLADFRQGALSENRERETMETWDIALLVVAGYVATFGLARLMTRRREQLIDQFREQMDQGKPKSPKAVPESKEPQAA